MNPNWVSTSNDTSNGAEDWKIALNQNLIPYWNCRTRFMYRPLIFSEILALKTKRDINDFSCNELIPKWVSTQFWIDIRKYNLTSCMILTKMEICMGDLWNSSTDLENVCHFQWWNIFKYLYNGTKLSGYSVLKKRKYIPFVTLKTWFCAIITLFSWKQVLQIYA